MTHRRIDPHQASLENALRRALWLAADSVEPAAGGLDRIRAKISARQRAERLGWAAAYRGRIGAGVTAAFGAVVERFRPDPDRAGRLGWLRPAAALATFLFVVAGAGWAVTALPQAISSVNNATHFSPPTGGVPTPARSSSTHPTRRGVVSPARTSSPSPSYSCSPNPGPPVSPTTSPASPTGSPSSSPAASPSGSPTSVPSPSDSPTATQSPANSPSSAASQATRPAQQGSPSPSPDATNTPGATRSRTPTASPSLPSGPCYRK